MSAPMNPAAPPVKPRPSTVTISSYLLFLVAALQILGLIIALSVSGTISDVYEEAFAGTELADSGAMIVMIGTITGAAFGLLVAIGLVVLALLNNRGKNPARIVTWVLGGIFVCCMGIGVAMTAAGNVLDMGSSTDPNVPDQAEIQQMLEDRLPSWYTPVSTVTSVLGLIAVLVALILLALPASNEFFRKQQPVWEPPVPGSTYPGYPQAGPGYPQAGPSEPPTTPPAPPKA